MVHVHKYWLDGPALSTWHESSNQQHIRSILSVSLITSYQLWHLVFKKNAAVHEGHEGHTMKCLLSTDLFFFPPVQRKSGMSEALYGQNDVISSSYGAERKLCLVEAEPGHLDRMWHSPNTFSTKIWTLQVRTLWSTPQTAPFRYVKMPVVATMCTVLFSLVKCKYSNTYTSVECTNVPVGLSLSVHK